jgi:hypothetical protein
MATQTITLAVDEELLHRYRAFAAQSKSSVDALLRKHIADVVGGASEEQRAAVTRMIARSNATPFAAYAPPLKREDLYDRGEG